MMICKVGNFIAKECYYTLSTSISLMSGANFVTNSNSKWSISSLYMYVLPTNLSNYIPDLFFKQ